MTFVTNNTPFSGVQGAFFLLFLGALLLPLSVQADEALTIEKATNEKIAIAEKIESMEKQLVLDPVKDHSSPAANPVSEELEKKSKRLRFRDGPVCLCADGLTENDIKKAQKTKQE
ncbi:hypothetical protein [Cellvibrio mixtus]|uniref:hypothetical protein n=1 Tax=Cellvibrio mixtus TaxID=39650 RepID=UPI0005877A8D|nr:hypothetical protein [Cellvibrio mixtus]